MRKAKQYTSVEALMKGEGISEEVQREFRRLEKQERAAKVKLHEMIETAHAAGVKVSVSLEPNEMPLRFPSDHEHIKLLIDESERASKLGNKWQNADVPNPVAAENCFRMGWAYSLAASWLRCKLKGELGPEKK